MAYLLSNEQYNRAKYLISAIVKSGLLKYIPAIATAGMLMGESGFNDKIKNPSSSAGGLWQWTGTTYTELKNAGVLPKNCPTKSYAAREFVFQNYNFEKQVEMGIQFQARNCRVYKHFKSNLQKFYSVNGDKISLWAGDMNGWWGHFGYGLDAVLKNESKAGGGVYSDAQIRKCVGNKINYSQEIYDRLQAEGGESALNKDIPIGDVGSFDFPSGGGDSFGGGSSSNPLSYGGIVDGGTFSQKTNPNNTTSGLILGTYINQK